MKYANNVIELIGNTPLVKLNSVVDGLKANLLAKVEYMNPGGSVKDRIGIKMVEDAERRGLLKPGGTIVEPTSGNTGVGLAMAAAIKGYKCVFVMPDKMSDEKIRLLRAYGAEVVITPTNVEPESPESYYSVSSRLAKEIPGAYKPDQYRNMMNPQTHYETTGPEIWEQTGGKIDIFIAGMGTGGTISGVAKYLKEKNPNVIIVGVDPEGSLYAGDVARPYKVEGIGEDFIPETIDLDIIDEMVVVSDKESFVMTRRMAREEGILIGGSCGSAVAGAVKYMKKHNLDESKNIVVLLPDSGRNYLSKIFSDDWMKENGFMEPSMDTPISQLLSQKGKPRDLVYLMSDHLVSDAVKMMKEFDISQIPVMDNGEIVGSIQESNLLNIIFEDMGIISKSVKDIMKAPLPTVDSSERVSSVYGKLSGGTPAVIVTEHNKPVSLVTKMDMLAYIGKS
ncbi:cystathionine beta-synthase [bacterium]|nr:MAG: cystathionine beta-synthase [bacterium]